MNTLSKTTETFAAKREMFVAVTDLTEYDSGIILSITSEEEANASDADIIYIANEDGSFTYKSNNWVSQEIKEELPATIRDEKHLREVVAFLADEAA